MSMSLTYTPDRGVIFKGEGAVSGQETLVLNAELADDIINGKDIVYQIVDLLEVTAYNVSTNEIQTLADQDAQVIQHVPDMVIAIVVSEKFTYGMNRMYTSYLEMNAASENCSLFRSRGDAEAWIRKRIGDEDSG